MGKLEKRLAANNASLVTSYLDHAIARHVSGAYSVWRESDATCIETGLGALWQARRAIEAR